MGQEDQSGTKREQEAAKSVPAVESPQSINVEESGDDPQGRYVVMGHQHSGPLPSPDTLRGYEEVLPGTAEAIVAAFKSETPHRHQMEREMVESQAKRERSEEKYASTGQWMGFAIAVLGIGGGVALIWKHPNLAGTLGGVGITGATLGSIVVAFIKGRNNSKAIAKDSESQ